MAWDRWEDEAVSVLGEGVMNTVDHEMACEYPVVVRSVYHPIVFAMEQKTMEDVLSEGPNDDADNQLEKNSE